MWILNPLSWFKLVAGIKTILATFRDLLKAVLFQLRRKQQQRQMIELKNAVKEAHNAKTLEEKADAACKIEKSFNPDSDCDH